LQIAKQVVDELLGAGVSLALGSEVPGGSEVRGATIDRPAVLNAVDEKTRIELEAVWTAIEADPSVWVVVVTGTGDFHLHPEHQRFVAHRLERYPRLS
jgi:enoyl-CoA hydratase/carnithine racemase